jgi:hypothetical protein
MDRRRYRGSRNLWFWFFLFLRFLRLFAAIPFERSAVRAARNRNAVHVDKNPLILLAYKKPS